MYNFNDFIAFFFPGIKNEYNKIQYKHNHRLTDRVSQSVAIDHGLSDHDMIYCTKKTSLPKSHKQNGIFVWSMKKYTAGFFLGNLRKIAFANHLTYVCLKNTYIDFLCRFAELKFQLKLKANSKPWFDNETTLAI